jgi:hypothetical protein
MDIVSHPYLFRAGRNNHFSGETFSTHGSATPDLGPMGRV